MTQTLVALYSRPSDVEAARRELQAIGIPATDIQVAAEETSLDRTPSPAASAPRAEPGFFDWLFGSDVPDTDRDTYASRVRDGGTLISVRVADTQVDRVTDILERFDPVDIDERSDGGGAVGSGLGSVAAVAPGAAQRSGTGAGATTTEAGYAGRTRDTDEEVIPVVEEELRVGKRQVEGGRVRVRSYVVSTPVEEQVSLRDETVTVERRQATGDRPIGEDAFRERSYEMTEQDEEAVVSKTQRVKEEVVVRKDAAERTETVRDDLRRTEVEVDHDPETRTETSSTTRATTGTPGSGARGRDTGTTRH